MPLQYALHRKVIKTRIMIIIYGLWGEFSIETLGGYKLPWLWRSLL
jgi:hypothetical protein